MQVPFLDLKAQYQQVREELVSAVTAVLDSGMFVNGPAIEDLEQAMATYCGTEAGIAVSSGTDALLVSLMALGVGEGDEVITTPFTFFATAGCIWRVGAKPVFVDIEPDTFNLDPARIEPAITPRTKAILPVHLYGQVAAMDAICAIAQRHGLSVIEDAAQAIGSTYHGRKAGAIGTTGCFSYYPTKNLSAVGDAGLIVTGDADLAARLRRIRNHGQGETYIHTVVGGNFRMDTLQAAALLVKLKFLDAWNDARRRHAALYTEMLCAVPQVVTPAVREGNDPMWHQYVIRAPRRDALREHLKKSGVGAAIYYPLPLHLQECFAALGHARGDFPAAELAAEEVLALPIYPELSEEQMAYVVSTIAGFYA